MLAPHSQTGVYFALYHIRSQGCQCEPLRTPLLRGRKREEYTILKSRKKGETSQEKEQF
jgi:hypothetical protein